MSEPELGARVIRNASLILIAEDEEPIAEALALVIEDCGYTPLVAANGKQALELARQHRPALILTDLMMPQLTGAQLIAEVRLDATHQGYPAPPVVLMSAAGRLYTDEVGADLVIRKPFDLDEIEAILNRFAPLLQSSEE